MWSAGPDLCLRVERITSSEEDFALRLCLIRLDEGWRVELHDQVGIPHLAERLETLLAAVGKTPRPVCAICPS